MQSAQEFVEQEDMLVIIYTIPGVSFDSLDSRLARVQGNHIVDQALASGRQRDTLRWVWLLILVDLLASWSTLDG